MKDKLEMMAQVGRVEQHLAQFGQSRFMTATQQNVACEMRVV